MRCGDEQHIGFLELVNDLVSELIGFELGKVHVSGRPKHTRHLDTRVEERWQDVLPVLGEGAGLSSSARDWSTTSACSFPR